MPRDGVPKRLGSVSMNEEETFTTEPVVTHRYRLRADVGTEELFSRFFTFLEGDVIEWNLATNELTFERTVAGS